MKISKDTEARVRQMWDEAEPGSPFTVEYLDAQARLFGSLAGDAGNSPLSRLYYSLIADGYRYLADLERKENGN